jgi:hypothetical protein
MPDFDMPDFDMPDFDMTDFEAPGRDVRVFPACETPG